MNTTPKSLEDPNAVLIILSQGYLSYHERIAIITCVLGSVTLSESENVHQKFSKSSLNVVAGDQIHENNIFSADGGARPANEGECNAFYTQDQGWAFIFPYWPKEQQEIYMLAGRAKSLNWSADI